VPHAEKFPTNASAEGRGPRAENCRSRRVTLLGVPYDGGSSFLAGAADAPPAIRLALASPASNMWSERGVDLGDPALLGDAGDLDVRGAEWARLVAEIERGVGAVADAGSVPLVLGGDHSVTYPVVRALSRRVGPLSILHFDAHPDLYPEYDGNPFSHASPFARIMEEGLADRLVQVGIRTMNAAQRVQAERFRVEVVPWDALGESFALSFASPAYVSLDLDALDPAAAPGVSHREPGGLTVRQLLGVLHRLTGRLVGADLVEYNPSRDVDGVSASVCAKLVKELAGTAVALGPGAEGAALSDGPGTVVSAGAVRS
jgi:arginase